MTAGREWVGRGRRREGGGEVVDMGMGMTRRVMREVNMVIRGDLAKGRGKEGMLMRVCRAVGREKARAQGPWRRNPDQIYWESKYERLSCHIAWEGVVAAAFECGVDDIMA